jgi:hypothetical protein
MPILAQSRSARHDCDEILNLSVKRETELQLPQKSVQARVLLLTTPEHAQVGSNSELMLALEPADMALRVELDSDAADQIELGFQEIDMMLLILHQFLEVARDIG